MYVERHLDWSGTVVIRLNLALTWKRVLNIKESDSNSTDREQPSHKQQTRGVHRERENQMVYTKACKISTDDLCAWERRKQTCTGNNLGKLKKKSIQRRIMNTTIRHINYGRCILNFHFTYSKSQIKYSIHLHLPHWLQREQAILPWSPLPVVRHGPLKVFCMRMSSPSWSSLPVFLLLHI